MVLIERCCRQTLSPKLGSWYAEVFTSETVLARSLCYKESRRRSQNRTTFFDDLGSAYQGRGLGGTSDRVEEKRVRVEHVLISWDSNFAMDFSSPSTNLETCWECPGAVDYTCFKVQTMFRRPQSIEMG